MPLNSLQIGLSRCLLGEAVRYDGASKSSLICRSELAKHFNLQAVCPEVEAGMSVPRPAVELVQLADKLVAIGRDDKSLDVSQQLIEFSQRKIVQLNKLSGFVVTPRSPSCGLNSVPIKSAAGKVIRTDGTGLFTQVLMQCFPALPIIEEPELATLKVLISFQIRVIIYASIKHNNHAITSCLVNGELGGFINKMNKLGSLTQQMLILNHELNQQSAQYLSRVLSQLRELFNEQSAIINSSL